MSIDVIVTTVLVCLAKNRSVIQDGNTNKMLGFNNINNNRINLL